MLKYCMVCLLLISGGAYTQDADPTRPVMSERVTESERRNLPEFQLQSIFYQPGNSRALINGDIYRVGDEVSGFQVIDIEQERVQLERNGQELMLSVFGPEKIINGDRRP